MQSIIPTIFIPTYGRPNNQLTLNMLRKSGYTGKIYLVVDDTDVTIQQYIDNYGIDNLIVFNKNHYINTIQTVTNNPKYGCAVYARYAIEEIALHLGLSCFVVIDDDITRFRLRLPKDNKLRSIISFDLNTVFSLICDFMLTSNLMACGCAYVNSLMCGCEALSSENLLKNRQPCAVMFRNTAKSVEWFSDYLEDALPWYRYNIIGEFTPCLPYIQFDTPSAHKPVKDSTLSKSDGGSSDLYNCDGYEIAFRGCIVYPNFISIKAKLLDKNIYYSCVKKKDLPKILNPIYRKEN